MSQSSPIPVMRSAYDRRQQEREERIDTTLAMLTPLCEAVGLTVHTGRTRDYIEVRDGDTRLLSISHAWHGERITAEGRFLPATAARGRSRIVRREIWRKEPSALIEAIRPHLKRLSSVESITDERAQHMGRIDPYYMTRNRSDARLGSLEAMAVEAYLQSFRSEDPQSNAEVEERLERFRKVLSSDLWGWLHYTSFEPALAAAKLTDAQVAS